MDMDVAAVFLAGTLLYSLGFLIILCAIIIANNIIHKYWKSFGWKFFPEIFNQDARFMTKEEAEKITPTLNDTKATN